MTLEDFFTLTELKDGLTTPTRVNELLTVMQKEKEESVVKNVGEASRQWSVVATTIATTENKDCLDLFIQLDGLWFIDHWLKDAQKLGNDTENRFMEELIISLLRAVEKLQVDNRKSVSSGIGETVQGLFGHSSSMVREKAKALCDGWAPVQEIDAGPTDVKMIEESGEGPECPPVVISNEEKMEQVSDQKMLKEEMLTMETNVDSHVNDSGNVAVKVESDRSKSESTVLTGISGSTPTVQSDISQLDNKHIEEDAKEKQEIDSLDKASEVESITVSSLLEHKTLTENADNIEKTSEPDIMTEKKEETSDKDEDMVDGGDSSGGALMVSENKGGDADNPKTTSNTESDDDYAMKYGRVQSDDDDDDDDDSVICLRSSKRSMKGQDGNLISKRPSDMDLDYGMVDPLELARQVANEVEREVDSRERSCSSTSQNVSGSGIERASSPDSINEKEPESIVGPGKEVSLSPSAAAEPVNDVEKLVSKMESCEPNIIIPETQISEMAQESAPEKGFSGFDLNQEVSSEEPECRMDPVLTPVSVVSASRAAAADGLPVAPLQFEGTLGWKGSAATSAFRRIPEVERAFSHNNNSNKRLDRLDFDLNVTEGSEDVIEDLLSRDKKPITSFLEPSVEEPRRLERLQLDLNSLGDGDTGTIALDWKRDGRVASLRQNGPQSPSLSSSSSSMQPSFRNIDLNLNDHSTTPNNNNASFDNPFIGKLLFNNSNISGGSYKRDESVISIFGTQVEVKRKDSVPVPNGRVLDPPVDFSLGRSGPGLGLGPSMAYPNLPTYGHNGFAMGPAMSFSTPMYGGPPGGPIGQIGQIGPIPYMVDSRGAPIVPQLMGSSSSSSIPPPPFSQSTQPFIFNMGATGGPSGSNGAGPSRHNFDLNSGFMTDGGNRENNNNNNNNGGLRQFFGHSQVRPVDEQQFLRMNSLQQASSSSTVLGGKRQEPDSGWESFPINYKHHQQPPPPWQ